MIGFVISGSGLSSILSVTLTFSSVSSIFSSSDSFEDEGIKGSIGGDTGHSSLNSSSVNYRVGSLNIWTDDFISSKIF